MIALHHRPRPWRGEAAPLVEAFRRTLAHLVAGWALRHTGDPLPFLRGRRALQAPR